MPLTLGDVHVNTPLSNVLVSYFQQPDAFVARRAFPTVPVAKQSDRYYTIPRGEFNRDVAKAVAPGTAAPRIEHTYDNTPTYSCLTHKYSELIPAEIRANADSVINLDLNATQNIAHKILIRQEKDWVNTFFTGGVWSYDYDGNASAPTASTNEVVFWDDYSNSDPISDVRSGSTAITESTGYKPNTLVLGYAVYQKLLDHPDLIDRIKYATSTNDNPAVVNTRTMAAVFDVERVLVTRAIENTADEGQTDSHSFIGGKKALLCYSASNPSTNTPSAGYTFAWNGYLGGQAMARVRKWFDNDLESDIIEGTTSFDHKLISADLGAFWDSVIQ